MTHERDAITQEEVTMTKNGLSKAKQKDLDERLGGSYNDRFERAHAYYNFLKGLPEDEQILSFEQILTKTDHPETKKSGKTYNVAGISEVDKESFQRGLGKLIDGHFHYQLASRPTAANLAKAMWVLINGFRSDEEKIFGLGWLIADKVVPYLQIPPGGVRLNNDTFNAMVDQLRPKIRMIDAILKWPELQATEMMSLGTDCGTDCGTFLDILTSRIIYVIRDICHADQE